MNIYDIIFILIIVSISFSLGYFYKWYKTRNMISFHKDEVINEVKNFELFDCKNSEDFCKNFDSCSDCIKARFINIIKNGCDNNGSS